MRTPAAPASQRSLPVPHSEKKDRALPLTRLDPDRLADHIDVLYRAAYALSGSRHDAEDLVQETFTHVLKRPRFVRPGHELGYLFRALRNTHHSRHRAATRRPPTVALPEGVANAAPEPSFNAREIMLAVASAPAVYREAVIAVDIVGLSYNEAARALRAPMATIRRRCCASLTSTAGSCG